MIEAVPKVLTFLTVVTDVLLVAFAVSAVLARVSKWVRTIRGTVLRCVRPNARILAFIIGMVAMLGSLFYSDVLEYTPCLLCWYQRIAMYPIPFLLGMAIVKNDRRIAPYVMMLALIGAIISAYHYYIQLGGATILPCSAVGYSVECSQRFSLEWGYVTIPVMAFSAFTAIIVLMQMIWKQD